MTAEHTSTTCAWPDCNNRITADSNAMYFCGHVCQRRWTCTANGIDHNIDGLSDIEDLTRRLHRPQPAPPTLAHF